jgi:tRNA(Leu) C34 or U34 (ribose-2'-O)-methylase TrmL
MIVSNEIFNELNPFFLIIQASKQMFEEMLEKRKQMKRSDASEDRSYSPSNNRFLPLYKNIPIDYQSFWQAFSNIKSTDHSTIIIGGETEGISLQARKLTIENKGKMVYIPLLNDVESLNVSIALSVILIELRKSYEDLVQKSYSIEQKDE